MGRRIVRRRRNPGMNIMEVMTKHAIPIGVSLYVSRMASSRLATANIPGIDRIPPQFQGPVMAGAVFAIAQFATKRVAPIKKWRQQIMIGAGINLFDKIVSAVAPDNVKAMFGVGNDAYGPVGEYLQVGADIYSDMGAAQPIDDDIALSEYMQVGQYFETEDIPGLEEDLGADLYADLGVEEDLGLGHSGGADFADRRLGGVTRSAMQRRVPYRSFVAPVPERSFTKKVPEIGAGFDNSARLYTGIFSGGF